MSREGSADDITGTSSERRSRLQNKKNIGSLKGVAAEAGVLYGCAVGNNLFSDESFRSLILTHCASLTSTWQMKMKEIWLAPANFDFSETSRLLDFAEAHQMKMRGTCLWWHNSVPDWFRRVEDDALARKLAVRYIRTVTAYYSQAVLDWDVVNEPIDVYEKDFLRRDRFYDLFGDKAIDVAFETMNQSDPKTKGFLCDYLFFRSDTLVNRKVDAILTVLSNAVARGVPIHGFSYQAHLMADFGVAESHHQRLFDGIRSLGLELIISELDVRELQSGLNIYERDAIIASVYHDFIDLVLEYDNLGGIYTWGLSDKYTWARDTWGNPDRHSNPRPLLFDENYNPKPAFASVMRAFRAHSEKLQGVVR